MRTFSIDSENNITVIASTKEAQTGESFGSEEEWHRLTADWPTSRLLDTWNSIPGFTPVKRFQDRKTATARIWKAIQSLGGGVGAPAATVAPSCTLTVRIRPARVAFISFCIFIASTTSSP